MVHFQAELRGRLRHTSALKDIERALRELGTAATAMAANYESTEQAYKGAR